jgi:hypothetical protein
MGSHGRQEAASPGDRGSATSTFRGASSEAGSAAGQTTARMLTVRENSCSRFGPARRQCPQLVAGCAIAVLVPGGTARQVRAARSGSSTRATRPGWVGTFSFASPASARVGPRGRFTHWVRTMEGRSRVRGNPGCAKTGPRVDGAGFRSQAHRTRTGSVTVVSEFQFAAVAGRSPLPGVRAVLWHTCRRS